MIWEGLHNKKNNLILIFTLKATVAIIGDDESDFMKDLTGIMSVGFRECFSFASLASLSVVESDPSTAFISKRMASTLLHFRRRRQSPSDDDDDDDQGLQQGIVCECCYYQCSIGELREYCGK